MPLYEYYCSACQKCCELLQKASDPAAVHCPHCGKERLQRQVSAPHFQLKGTGWYVTDFKNKGTPEAKSAENKSEAKAENKTTDSKTDKTTDSGESKNTKPSTESEK